MEESSNRFIALDKPLKKYIQKPQNKKTPTKTWVREVLKKAIMPWALSTPKILREIGGVWVILRCNSIVQLLQYWFLKRTGWASTSLAYYTFKSPSTYVSLSSSVVLKFTVVQCLQNCSWSIEVKNVFEVVLSVVLKTGKQYIDYRSMRYIPVQTGNVSYWNMIKHSMVTITIFVFEQLVWSCFIKSQHWQTFYQKL